MIQQNPFHPTHVSSVHGPSFLQKCSKSEHNETESEEENSQVKRGLKELKVELRSLKKRIPMMAKRKRKRKSAARILKAEVLSVIVWRGDIKNLNLTDAVNVITLYALYAVPPQLVVPDELKASISGLPKEVLKLSQTIS
ncbi:hypothetical protein FEM48_Zijuj12G0116800 [Ziziphus jujuba var. spinosa]|uniref:Uncharacterized protein n=1 Tax=Ziziphus jujuba var. spinosa TaxID=714518 RepID=A0A978UD40_ZIZJJ|nr:hypothetical protein FEM48_Zijuj12G0116800 [Ziziphus jujuba var. spinosa]